jgi:streptogramin lyase
MWFTEEGIGPFTGPILGGKIGRIAADGTITEYGSNLSTPYSIILGPDGKLWFTELGVSNTWQPTPSTGKIGTIVP